MADLDSVRPYPALERHRRELRDAARRRRRGLLIGVPLASALIAALYIVSPPGALLAAVVAVMLGFFLLLPGASPVDPGELAGVEGERATLDRLRALPDDYRVINRVRLPDPRLPNGERELDFVVAGPTGLWVIEVKNTPGLVQIVPGARRWPLAKRSGCSSCPAWNAMDNPEHQLRNQLDALRQWLLINGVALEPRGAICLAHPEVAIRDADDAAYPVCVPDQLPDRLQSESQVARPRALPALLDALRASPSRVPGPTAGRSVRSPSADRR